MSLLRLPRLSACGATALAIFGCASAYAGSSTNIDQADQSERSAPAAQGRVCPVVSKPPPLFALAGGGQFGIGFLIPTLHQPVWHLLAHLGAAIHLAPAVSLVLAGELGLDAVFNTAAASDTNYGYALRVPLHARVEIIHSNLFDYQRRRYINLHFGLSFGGDFLLAANCAASCAYVAAGVYTGVRLRVGASYSVDSRNALGIYITPHLTVAHTQDPGAPSVALLTTSVALAYTFF